MSLLSKLLPYRRANRPVLPASLPLYIDAELQRVSVVTANLVEALQALEGRLAQVEAKIN